LQLFVVVVVVVVKCFRITMRRNPLSLRWELSESLFTFVAESEIDIYLVYE
jgi:hypothetical protein